MVRNEKNISEDFIKYTEFIAKHPNYSGLPEKYKKDGSVRWVVSGNSKLGKQRANWWDELVEKFSASNRAEIARLIHPKELNGMKPCQTCGKKLSIFYVYPTKTTLKKLNQISEINFESYDLTITEIFNQLFELNGESTFNEFRNIFSVPPNIPNKKDKFLEYIKNNPGKKLSPGVMSNAPDRFDGFHSYNACCRSKEDTGRHKTNLARYSQDRRAYENWAEGNWNLSNRLMGEFNRYNTKVICPQCGKLSKMTADHIGPISLGFTHRPKFNPLCTSCNSSKNNRMSYNDIRLLLNDENNGEQVISWHSKYLWDNLKYKINNDDDALKLSKIMREHIHKILNILSIIKDNNNEEFLLLFLHPDYSFYDYTFENFNPLNLNELKINKKPLDSKNKEKNAKRYLRISFESLDNYKSKENRKLKNLNNKYNPKINLLLKELNNKDYIKSKEILNEIIIDISDDEIKEFNN